MKLLIVNDDCILSNFPMLPTIPSNHIIATNYDKKFDGRFLIVGLQLPIVGLQLPIYHCWSSTCRPRIQRRSSLSQNRQELAVLCRPTGHSLSTVA